VVIEGFKQIAEHITRVIGISVTENAARKWAARARDPLPVERFAGRVFAKSARLDDWIGRQRGQQRQRLPDEEHEG
jgi:hypothetical protein